MNHGWKSMILGREARKGPVLRNLVIGKNRHPWWEEGKREAVESWNQQEMRYDSAVTVPASAAQDECLHYLIRAGSSREDYTSRRNLSQKRFVLSKKEKRTSPPSFVW